MDPVRAMLLALAEQARHAQRYWQAGLAAVRARGHAPTLTEAFAHHAQAELCLLAALRAAGLPAGFRIDGITLSQDPVTAVQQLRERAAGHDPAGPIEAEHEAARQAYRQAYEQPVTEPEQTLAQHLAALEVARRDRVVDLAATLAGRR